MNGMYRILIVIGILVYCLAFQGTRSLWEPDDGRYTAVAMEMLRHGDWLRPQLHREQPHWTKPPLTYWAIAASVSLLGRNEFAARLPCTLSYFFTICLVYILGRIFLKRRAWLAPLVYASFILPSVASNFITTDCMLALWETLAICGYAYAVWGDNRSTASTWMLVMWGAFGLAFLTKGPPGLLPLIAVVAHRLWRGRSADTPRLRWRSGILLMLTIGMSWYVLVIASQPTLFHYFVVHEIYGRVVTGEHGRNSEWRKAIVIYLPVLVLGTLPWTFWLGRYTIKSIRTLLHSPKKSIDSNLEQDLFLFLWILCPLLIFVVSSSRLPLYLLPLFTPVAILAGRGLEELSYKWNRRWLAGITAWCLLLVALRIISAQISTEKDDASVAQAIRASTTRPFSEIVFLDTGPINGLNFYLDKDVESVTLDMLDDELGEAETRLWVLRPNHAALFLEKMEARGLNLQEIGRIDKRYLLFQVSGTPVGLIQEEQPSPSK
jgi:4-amino-4-deoxy-L-arabinose transferase-like glycosyltransferase